jgi:hypothetical protein
MAVHLLQLPTEPAEWASRHAIGKVHIAPQWPESTRFALIAVVRNPGARDRAQTRALWVTTAEEMDRLLTNHKCRILWFTVARHQIASDMIERTLSGEERVT